MRLVMLGRVSVVISERDNYRQSPSPVPRGDFMELLLEKGSIIPPNLKTTMPSNTQPRVSLPTYVLPLLVTLLLAFLANLSYSLYWAGQMASNQANLVDTLREVKTEVRELRIDNQRLREQVTALTAARPSR